MKKKKELKKNISLCFRDLIQREEDLNLQLELSEDEEAKEVEKEMEIVMKDKYLGDVIKNDGKHDKTIESRVSSGLGQISALITILNEVSFGQYYYQMGTILRSTLVMSSMLLNSEAWVNLLEQNISDLEATDRILLRRVLNAPLSTGIPALYLELGCIPVRFIIKGRRIIFLNYLHLRVL